MQKQRLFTLDNVGGLYGTFKGGAAYEMPSNKWTGLDFPDDFDMTRLKKDMLIRATVIEGATSGPNYIRVEDVTLLNYPDIALKIKNCPVFLPAEDANDTYYKVSGTAYDPDGPYDGREMTLNVPKVSILHMAKPESDALDAHVPHVKGAYPCSVSIDENDVIVFHGCEVTDDGKTGTVHGIATGLTFSGDATVLDATNFYPGYQASDGFSRPRVDLQVKFGEGPYKDDVRFVNVSLAFQTASPKTGDRVSFKQITKFWHGKMAGHLKTGTP